jgi:hypothetical protein
MNIILLDLVVDKMFIFVSQELVRKLKATPESKKLEDDLRNKGVDRDHISKRLKEAFGLSQRGKTLCLYKLEIKEYPLLLYLAVYKFSNYDYSSSLPRQHFLSHRLPKKILADCIGFRFF